jgi:DNA invertase Pin-like site-specific DNA recombinase
MNSKIIKGKIDAGQIILYRRVSTKRQAKDEYAHQLRCIKLDCPGFSIARSTTDHIEEVMSGCAGAEVRMASGLGQLLKLLKRNPEVVGLVSNADRLARQADIFILIQKQGLGQRVFEASTGMSLDDIIQTGRHNIIEKTTESLRASRQAGLDRLRASGVALGWAEIAKQSRHGARKKSQLTRHRATEVLSVVSQLVSQSRGQCPPMSTISDELDHHDIRTGQGLPWTPERLSQHKKNNPNSWAHALDSYARPRRRLRMIITATQIENCNRRSRRIAMRRLFRKMPLQDIRTSKMFRASHSLGWRPFQTNSFRYRAGCRGPPRRACRETRTCDFGIEVATSRSACGGDEHGQPRRAYGSGSPIRQTS